MFPVAFTPTKKNVLHILWQVLHVWQFLFAYNVNIYLLISACVYMFVCSSCRSLFSLQMPYHVFCYMLAALTVNSLIVFVDIIGKYICLFHAVVNIFI